MVAAVAVAVEVAALVIPVDATTAGRADPRGVPDPSGEVRWQATRPRPLLYGRVPEPVEVVAAGAGVIVGTGDRIVALDGSTGTERWHYRRAGARVDRISATPDGRTVVADIDAGGDERSSSVLFAFDANTGEVRWSRPSIGARRPPITHSSTARPTARPSAWTSVPARRSGAGAHRPDASPAGRGSEARMPC